MVDGLPGRRVRLVAVDVARSDPGLDVDQRLLVIERRIEEVLEEHAPDTLAVERVFAQHNVSTVMGTAQVAGIAMVAAARRRIPVAMHTPSEVKAAVTGNGRAGKLQVQTMVARLLSLDELPKPADAADALALAICHLWRGAGQSRIEAALAKAAEARKARAELKEKLKMGTLSLSDVLAQADGNAIVGKTKVLAVIESLPGVGKVKARRTMEEIGIAESRTLKGLGAQQRKALLDAFA